MLFSFRNRSHALLVHPATHENVLGRNRVVVMHFRYRYRPRPRRSWSEVGGLGSEVGIFETGILSISRGNWCYSGSGRIRCLSSLIRESSQEEQGDAMDLNNDVLIRTEEQRDIAAVHGVNEAAFETAAEADLVDVLRAQAGPVISLVAESGEAVIGHIMFSTVTLPGHHALQLMGLGPMAVAPAYQRRGVGSALVRAGLERCRQIGCGAVVVLGHPEYYPRFGFQSSKRFSMDCEYDVPSDIFMVMELESGYLRGAAGRIQYHPAFRGL